MAVSNTIAIGAPAANWQKQTAQIAERFLIQPFGSSLAVLEQVLHHMEKMFDFGTILAFACSRLPISSRFSDCASTPMRANATDCIFSTGASIELCFQDLFLVEGGAATSAAWTIVPSRRKNSVSACRALIALRMDAVNSYFKKLLGMYLLRRFPICSVM